MTNLQVTMACGPYDRLQALKEGIIKPEGIDLRYIEIQSPPEIFARMLKTHSFDIAEMSSAHYITMKSRGNFPYIALPVFPSRLFRHGFIFINQNSGISRPSDLKGKRIAVQEYRQSAGVWIRGILKSEYGVDFSDVTWFEGGVDTPRRFDETMDLRPSGALNLKLIGPDKSISDVLSTGEVDAYFGARAPKAFFECEDVVRLFPNYRAEERAYFERTGIYPIMHTMVMPEAFHEANPWAAEALFKALSEAKKWAIEQMRFSGAQRYMLPWLFDDIDEMDVLFNGDPCPYGIEPNRLTLNTAVEYLFDQGFIENKMEVDDLFAPIVGWTE